MMDTHLFNEGFVASAAEVLLEDGRVTNHSSLPGIFQCYNQDSPEKYEMVGYLMRQSLAIRIFSNYLSCRELSSVRSCLFAAWLTSDD